MMSKDHVGLVRMYGGARTFENQLHPITLARAVLTNGHTGHVPRVPGFFPFEGPRLAVVKYFLTNCFIVDATA